MVPQCTPAALRRRLSSLQVCVSPVPHTRPQILYPQMLCILLSSPQSDWLPHSQINARFTNRMIIVYKLALSLDAHTCMISCGGVRDGFGWTCVLGRCRLSAGLPWALVEHESLALSQQQTVWRGKQTAQISPSLSVSVFCIDWS